MAKLLRDRCAYPAWVERLALPVWVSSPQGSLSFVNSHAEALLGIQESQVLGMPCHRVLRGTDASNQVFCAQRCRLRRSIRASVPSTPVRVRLGDADRRTWALLLIIPIANANGSLSSLVHCAFPLDREHRIEEYVKGLARRGRSRVELPAPIPSASLTPREQGVMERLAAGRSLRETSQEFHVSYSTIRNHVQHVLAKLGAHSIQEAVALWLLREGPKDVRRGRRSD